jgi:ribosomal protein S7
MPGWWGGAEPSRCSWCSSKEMHQLFKVLGQQDQCPVKALASKAKTKEAAKWIVDQKKSDPKKEIHQLLASALTQFE